MAENSDSILEEASGQESNQQEETAKKGLSPSLLIKVVIGLVIVLLALIAVFFLMPASDEDQTKQVSESVQTDNLISPEADEADAMPDDVVDKPQMGSIELPDMPEANSAGTSTSPQAEATVPMVTSTQETTVTASSSSDKVLAELVALQQQLLKVQQENQNLIKRVQDLASENEVLKTQVGQLSAERPSNEAIMNDERLVNTGNEALYSRQNQYANTKQIELKPKWGEFDVLSSASN